MVAVRKVTHSDVPAVAAALARAFHDDPVMTFILPGDKLEWRIRRIFETEMARWTIRQGETYTTDDGVRGAAIWAPPGKWKVPWWQLLPAAPSMLRAIGRRARRGFAAISVIESKHPREPHYYLGTLGTDPAHQGKGVGSALMQPVLDRCDADGVPAYLESSKEKNIPYYRRHGFEVTDEIQLPGGPPLWSMWREPQSPTTR